MASNPTNTTQMNDTFTVTVINLLSCKLSSRITDDMRTQFQVLYQARIQETLQGRGIYSTGTIGVSVDYKMVTYNPWDKDGTTRRKIIEDGDAFIILFDLAALDAATQLHQEIRSEDRRKFIPVVLKTVYPEHIGMCTLPECSQESHPGPTSSSLADAFENLSIVVETEKKHSRFTSKVVKCRRQRLELLEPLDTNEKLSIGLILPLTKPDGSADLTSVLSHVTLLEQTVDNLQKNTVQLQTDLQGDYDDLKSHVDLNVHNKVTSNSANVTTLQSDVNVLAKLDILNTTVYAVQSEARRLTENISSMVQLLEHKQLVENMDTQSVKTLAQDTSIQLKLLEKDVNATSFDVGHIKQNLHSMDADLHVVQNDVTMTRSEIQTMKQTMSDIDKNSTAVKQALAQVAQTMASKTRDVAFQAYLSDTQTVQSDTSLIFHRVFLNSGSGYSSTTGTFTAPVSGTFMFWTQLDVDQADVSLTVSIQKSGTSIATGWVKTTTDSDDEVVSVITASHVTAGEEVWVQVNLTALIYGASYSHFGGTILSVD
ncbi:uncharacterized protein LOC124138798 [Haliotis rufescens]|uniref:uncharacterized protein LOC124138798 n=1 Tax=Haliotis rufescens TaxID=6454 RepID=UPI00201E9860|nr:uncharacterized protein LOC124138798 [Haliotis rufescens]